jgi:hypothetical protein
MPLTIELLIMLAVNYTKSCNMHDNVGLYAYIGVHRSICFAHLKDCAGYRCCDRIGV